MDWIVRPTLILEEFLADENHRDAGRRHEQAERDTDRLRAYQLRPLPPPTPAPASSVLDRDTPRRGSRRIAPRATRPGSPAPAVDRRRTACQLRDASRPPAACATTPRIACCIPSCQFASKSAPPWKNRSDNRRFWPPGLRRDPSLTDRSPARFVSGSDKTATRRTCRWTMTVTDRTRTRRRGAPSTKNFALSVRNCRTSSEREHRTGAILIGEVEAAVVVAVVLPVEQVYRFVLLVVSEISGRMVVDDVENHGEADTACHRCR